MLQLALADRTSSAHADLLWNAVRKGSVRWPVGADGDLEARFLAATSAHGVQPLLHHQLRATSAWHDWPPNVREQLARAARGEVVVELFRRDELARVLEALAARGVFPLLMKGTPLAYTHYPSPHLRPRSDTDLLIRESDIQPAEQVMVMLGHVRASSVRGTLISHQFTYVKEHGSRVRFAYDFHWKIANPHLFAELLTFDELTSRAVLVPALGAYARTLDPVHALLLACIHLIAHHSGRERLIWLYDIRLLVEGMSGDELERFVRVAAVKRLQSVCLRGLTLAQRWTGAAFPPSLLEDLSGCGPRAAERAARHLRPQLRRLHVFWSDLRTLVGWRRRVRFLLEHAFPDAGYMLSRYSVTHRALLPALYLHRAIRGVLRSFRSLEST